MPETDIKTALDTLKVHLEPRQRYINYYDGRHELSFATDKFKTAFGKTLKNMRDNLCPIVVDAVADRMEVINFAGDDEEKDKAIADAAWKLWQRERMELVSNETHVEALKTGAAYVIVWSDDENKAKFYLQDSRTCVVIVNEETDVPKFGAKMWRQEDKFVRLNLYYSNTIEKYITNAKKEPGTEIKPAHFKEAEEGSVDNPYGVIPMFKFDCLPVLSDAIPIQDALNKTVCDMLVAQEFAAFPQRWATGLEPNANEVTGIPELPFKAGVDRLWFTADGTAKFGQFTAADMEAFIKTGDSFRLEMARVSGTPLHFFSINTSDAISGEALKTLESRFTKKAKRLQINFGSVWSKAMKLALTIEKESVPENLTAQWESPEQRSEKEMLEAALNKVDLGIPEETIWEEIGYGPEQIEEFKKAKEAEPEVDPVKAMAQLANGGTQKA